MNNFLVLLTGEVQRLIKYNIFTANILVSFIWIGVLHFAKVQDVTDILPLLIFLDVTSMSILLIGVTMFFEKQEGTIKTLLVSPINKNDYVISKTFGNIASNVVALLIIYVYAVIFREVNVNIVALLGAVALVSFLHSLIGFLITYGAKDFTGVLMGMMKYAFILMIPVLLDEIGLITNELLRNLIYIVPTKAAMILMQSSAGGIESWEILISLTYLIVLSGIMYFLVYKKFDEFAVKESGA